MDESISIRPRLPMDESISENRKATTTNGRVQSIRPRLPMDESIRG